ncbi:hypothetical protein JCM10213_001865 [Rhodosporidiobolus nylandii]
MGIDTELLVVLIGLATYMAVTAHQAQLERLISAVEKIALEHQRARWRAQEGTPEAEAVKGGVEGDEGR